MKGHGRENRRMKIINNKNETKEIDGKESTKERNTRTHWKVTMREMINERTRKGK